MKKLFLVPTVRFDLMMKLAASWKISSLSDWDWAIFFQSYTPQQIREVSQQFGANLVWTRDSPDRASPYLGRAEIYKSLADDYDVFGAVDDDMQFLPETTNYEPAVRKVMESGTGVVSCNWVRFNTPGLMARVRNEDVFLRQPIVYGSGAMIYGRKVVREVFNHPIKQYMFDDVQLALVAYLAGYENYRYLGSVIVHSVMLKGGMKTLYGLRDMEFPDDRYIQVRPSMEGFAKNNNYHMPETKDLLPAAHELHKANAAKLVVK